MNEPNRQDILAYALGGIGPSASNAVPFLLQVLKTSSRSARAGSSFRALGEIHARPLEIVPALISLLDSPDDYVRDESIGCLQAYGTNARLAVSKLADLLSDQDKDVRKDAAKALKVIDPAAAAKAGVP